MVSVEIYSDVVCPWCYIGKRRWETALQELVAARGASVLDEIQVVFRPYQLDPTAPATPTPVAQAYAKKFGGAARAEEIIANVTQIASTEGLGFRMDLALRANTRDAHRLLDLALTVGLQHDLKEHLMRAYFVEGLDVGSHDVLVSLADQAGMDAELVRGYLASDVGIVALDNELAAANEIGVSAVPTFVFNGEFAVPGAQDPAVFVRVLSKLLDQSAA